MQFTGDEFDCTFSTDVLEHISAELIEEVVDEICRITREYTIHVVCTRPSGYEEGLHLTVRPVEWWRRLFQQHNMKGIKCIIVDCEEFLILYRMKLWDMTHRGKCTCGRLFDNKDGLTRHLKLCKENAKHLPDLCHKDTQVLFEGELKA